jgi:hypothetical protein
MDKVDLAEKLAGLDEPFRPGIVGYLNDYKLAVVKLHGKFVHKRSRTGSASRSRHLALI